MARYGVCAWIYGEAPLRQTLERIAAAGYDGVELPGEPSRMPAAEVRRLLHDAGLHPAGLTASCMYPTTPRDLGHPDPAMRAQAVRYVETCLRFAAEIEAPLVQMLPSGETRLRPLASRAEEWGWSVAAMQHAALEAERVGVRICIEPLNRYETSLINTCEQVLGFIADVDEPNLFVHLDTFHMNIEERDLYGAITLAGDRLGYVQLAESDRGLPGKGHVPWEAVFEGLRDADFAGPLAFESFTTDNVVLAKAACLWRDVVGDPDAFVTEGRAAMRSVAEKVGYRFPA
jgi:D-psicose/D-tagatose/L-ribulose 3-epimerase